MQDDLWLDAHTERYNGRPGQGLDGLISAEVFMSHYCRSSRTCVQLTNVQRWDLRYGYYECQAFLFGYLH